MSEAAVEALATVDFNDQFLAVIPQGLDKAKVDGILARFKEDVSLAPEVFERAMGIVVTDESQTELMKQARDLRLTLKNDRVRIENTRKGLKEQSLREGQLIDGIARTLKEKIEPAEKHLEAQEHFAAIREAERKAALQVERVKELVAVEFDPTGMDLGAMSEDSYTTLLDSAIAAKAKRESDAREAEEARAKEERERQEREANLKAENDRLAAEKSEADRLANEERQGRLAAEAEAKRLEDERIEKERQAKAEEERIAAEKRDAEAKAAAAPDKEKLLQFIADVCEFGVPVVASAEAKAAIAAYKDELAGILARLRTAADKL